MERGWNVDVAGVSDSPPGNAGNATSKLHAEAAPVSALNENDPVTDDPIRIKSRGEFSTQSTESALAASSRSKKPKATTRATLTIILLFWLNKSGSAPLFIAPSKPNVGQDLLRVFEATDARSKDRS